ncbi:M28 family peptidase [Ilyomonas limi]|uniref:M28 family peptidase n=1 Tax=Ilyomonas limi TaxID=2575867 RepID=A0A4U3L6N2_9BACT|nr:M28 family metallopeptidase [Ilyomonas limi]TKK70911.1 M28 family peptidase [Ilyomonas limi]
MKNHVLFLCCCFVVHTASNAQSTTISGFSNADAQAQLSIEKQFDQNLNAANIGNTIKQLSSHPHHIGSAGGKAVADSIYNRFKSYGWEVRIDTYHVLFPTPKTRLLQMTAPTTYKALLKEPALKEDATSGQQDQLPTYNAWSADGDVTAGLIFVNYGLPEDYDMLDRMGVSVKGKIVIAKYGHSWRGIKPKVAQEHGALGCIIYSDPADDGYFAGDVYPKGAFKNEYGVQRGSVMDMPVYPGDPLTPNVGATANAQRIERSEAANLLKIPVLPISYHDAQPLLKALEGPVAPAAWHGGLPFAYHIGGGTTQVHLKLAFNWDIVPCYNVIAAIKGSQYPDEWIVRGNHHDAWVNGANDPISGIAAMLEEAKSIGDMLKSGWRPKRTLVYCAWDGEEPALLGSTEWVEDHLKELQQKAVVYINSDGNARGFLNAGGSPALQQMVNEVAATVTDPQTGVSVLKRRLAKETADATTTKAKEEALAKKEMELGALGSGSDFSPFLQFAGIPSLNIEYGGEDAGGDYHSIYDSYDNYRRFKDPSFQYGVALAQTIGRVALRQADAQQLPFYYQDFYKDVNEYTNQLITLANDMRESTALETELLKDSIYTLAADTAKHLLPPQPKTAVPYFDFAPLQNAVAHLQKTTDSLHQVLVKMNDANTSDVLNKTLYQAEQQLLLPEGLPRRGWYKHAVYAPGFYTGYGVKTLPGIREAVEQRNWTEAQAQIQLAADAIDRLNNYLQQIHD